MTTNILTSLVTAYCHCALCCGKPGQPAANGKQPIAGQTIAAPRSVPLGSIVIIDGHTYTAQDRTAKRFDGRFDIFMPSHKQALQWGKQNKQVTASQHCSKASSQARH